MLQFNIFSGQPESTAIFVKRKALPRPAFNFGAQMPAYESTRTYIGQRLYVKPSMVVSVPEYDRPSNFRTVFQQEAQANLSDNSNKGLLSKKGISKLRSAVNWLVSAAETKQVYHSGSDRYFDFKVGFCTLTIPGGQPPPSNYDFKTKLLNPWLTLMRQKYGLRNYVWKLELQKDGMPHVHITWDSFIHYSVIRSTWNRLLRSAGLIEVYTQKYYGCTFEQYLSMIPKRLAENRSKAFKSWQQGVADCWLNPNSTDIHSVKSVRDLAAYIIKYMSKQGKLLSDFKGRIWYCSQSITEALKLRVFIPSPELKENLGPFFRKEIEYSELTFPSSVPGRVVKFGEVFKLKLVHWYSTITGSVSDAFHDTIARLRLVHSGAPAVYIV